MEAFVDRYTDMLIDTADHSQLHTTVWFRMAIDDDTRMIQIRSIPMTLGNLDVCKFKGKGMYDSTYYHKPITKRM